MCVFLSRQGAVGKLEEWVDEGMGLILQSIGEVEKALARQGQANISSEERPAVDAPSSDGMIGDASGNGSDGVDDTTGQMEEEEGQPAPFGSDGNDGVDGGSDGRDDDAAQSLSKELPPMPLPVPPPAEVPADMQESAEAGDGDVEGGRLSVTSDGDIADGDEAEGSPLLRGGVGEGAAYSGPPCALLDTDIPVRSDDDDDDNNDNNEDGSTSAAAATLSLRGGVGSRVGGGFYGKGTGGVVPAVILLRSKPHLKRDGPARLLTASSTSSSGGSVLQEPARTASSAPTEETVSSKIEKVGGMWGRQRRRQQQQQQPKEKVTTAETDKAAAGDTKGAGKVSQNGADSADGTVAHPRVADVWSRLMSSGDEAAREAQHPPAAKAEGSVESAKALDATAGRKAKSVRGHQSLGSKEDDSQAAARTKRDERRSFFSRMTGSGTSKPADGSHKSDERALSDAECCSKNKEIAKKSTVTKYSNIASSEGDSNVKVDTGNKSEGQKKNWLLGSLSGGAGAGQGAPSSLPAAAAMRESRGRQREQRYPSSDRQSLANSVIENAVAAAAEGKTTAAASAVKASGTVAGETEPTTAAAASSSSSSTKSPPKSDDGVGKTAGVDTPPSQAAVRTVLPSEIVASEGLLYTRAMLREQDTTNRRKESVLARHSTGTNELTRKAKRSAVERRENNVAASTTRAIVALENLLLRAAKGCAACVRLTLLSPVRLANAGVRAIPGSSSSSSSNGRSRKSTATIDKRSAAISMRTEVKVIKGAGIRAGQAVARIVRPCAVLGRSVSNVASSGVVAATSATCLVGGVAIKGAAKTLEACACCLGAVLSIPERAVHAVAVQIHRRWYYLRQMAVDVPTQALRFVRHGSVAAARGVSATGLAVAGGARAAGGVACTAGVKAGAIGQKAFTLGGKACVATGQAGLAAGRVAGQGAVISGRCCRVCVSRAGIAVGYALTTPIKLAATTVSVFGTRRERKRRHLDAAIEAANRSGEISLAEATEAAAAAAATAPTQTEEAPLSFLQSIRRSPYYKKLMLSSRSKSVRDSGDVVSEIVEADSELTETVCNDGSDYFTATKPSEADVAALARWVSTVPSDANNGRTGRRSRALVGGAVRAATIALPSSAVVRTNAIGARGGRLAQALRARVAGEVAEAGAARPAPWKRLRLAVGLVAGAPVSVLSGR